MRLYKFIRVTNSQPLLVVFYLFACWKLYSIIFCAFIPGAKILFANKLFPFFATTMAASCFGPYHSSMWREDALSGWIGAITTPWAMMLFALGFGVFLQCVDGEIDQ
jgi:hypothetical protein